MIVDSAVEYGPNSTLRGLERAARAAGYSVISATVGDDDPLGPSVAFDHLMSQGIDALCLIAPRSSSLDHVRSSSMHMPALVVTAAKDDTFLTVSVDQELGAALAVRHLIDLGHRRIAHVAGPLDWLDAWARHRAWQTEIKAAGLDELDVVVGDWTAGFGYEVAHVAGRLPDCTAVFAANDQIALGSDPRLRRARHPRAGRHEHRRLRRPAGVEALPAAPRRRCARTSGHWVNARSRCSTPLSRAASSIAARSSRRC